METVFRIIFVFLIAIVLGVYLLRSMQGHKQKYALPISLTICGAYLLFIFLFAWFNQKSPILETNAYDYPQPSVYQINPIPEQQNAVHPGETEAGDHAIRLVSVTQVVPQGKKASITVQGTPNTLYAIQVLYGKNPSRASGLEAKRSDADGCVTWTWTVGANTTCGAHSVTVTDGHATNTFYFTVAES